MLSGTRLSTSQRCSMSWNFPNTGKAENTARPRANKGTKANTVVKVSELALTPSRASRKRSANTPPICRQGNTDSSCHHKRVCSRRPDLVKVVCMPGMMPSQ